MIYVILKILLIDNIFVVHTNFVNQMDKEHMKINPK